MNALMRIFGVSPSNSMLTTGARTLQSSTLSNTIFLTSATYFSIELLDLT